MTNLSATTTVLTNYLDRAMGSLRTLGISFVKPEEAPVLAILEKTAKYDAVRVTSIAATMQQSSVFNQAVRDQIQGMDVSARYAEITSAFNSIREDAGEMAKMMEDGKLDMSEKLKLAWMKLRRGSIPDRFNAIRDTYLEVSKATGQQIDREQAILTAYQDFRLALKSAEIDAQEVLKIAATALAVRRVALASASSAVEAYAGEDGAERTRLELARDEALRALQDEDKSYQVVKDIADDLKTAYNTADLVFARLQQSHAVKDRLYQRSITFFATNEVVFSGLAASFTAMSGLSEATQTMEAMKDGMSKGLEDLAATGNTQMEAGLRAGYGSTLKTSSVKALADAVVEYQASSLKLIEELRAESTRTALEIEQATEDGKRRFTALLNQSAN